MMRTKRNRILAILFAGLLCVGGGLFWAMTETQKKEPVISRIYGNFGYNTEDPREVAGVVDYVFVAYVERFDKTEHRHDLGEDTEPLPYSHYTVRVAENLKGTLRTDVSIPLEKYGGLFHDGKHILLYENDILPQVGKYYVFNAVALEDGSISLCGENVNIPLEADVNEKSLEKSAAVEQYRAAVKNQIAPSTDWARFTSKYEVKK